MLYPRVRLQIGRGLCAAQSIAIAAELHVLSASWRVYRADHATGDSGDRDTDQDDLRHYRGELTCDSEGPSRQETSWTSHS